MEDHEILEFIKKQTWDNIPPTGKKAIEKLMIENIKLKRDIQEVIDKNIELENGLVKLKKMMVDVMDKVNNDPSAKSNMESKVTSLSATISDLKNEVSNLSNQNKV